MGFHSIAKYELGPNVRRDSYGRTGDRNVYGGGVAFTTAHGAAPMAHITNAPTYLGGFFGP